MSSFTRRRDLEPYLSPEQFEFRDAVHKFLTRHSDPSMVRQWDEEKQFPAALIQGAVEQGWFALTLPEAYGGIGDYMDMTAFLEVAGYHNLGLARFWNANVNMVGGAVSRFASDAMKQEVLPDLAAGKCWLAFALSENGSGSDAAALRTRAEQAGDDFIINGTKMWITGAMQAKYILTAVRTDRDAKKHDGISLFLVPTNSKGLKVSPIDMLGGHAIRTCEVNYEDVRVKGDRMVGELHVGWKRLLTVLAKERVALSAICVGAAQAACDLAREYALERKQFDQSIYDFQAISHMLVDMQTQVDAARMMSYRAARLLASGAACEAEASQAKYFAADAYVRVSTDGLQIMGANGYAMEYAMQRHYRESKLFQIFGGTNQIQRNVVARVLRKGA
jgi:alkylation response protein AidB-like acyl-CoA dehydrogenase